MNLMILGIIAMFTVNTANAQAVSKGNLIIDAYYGFPNLYKTVFKAAYANSGEELNLKIGGIGPLGGRIEYMLADKIGLGLDIGFSNTTIDYQEYDSFDDRTYDYELKTQKLGVMVTFNYHFLQNADKFDAYAMAGAGYGNRTFDSSSNDPFYTSESFNGLIPVALRIGAGMRYFFTDNIGLNVAIGLGQGGILNAGISVKI